MAIPIGVPQHEIDLNQHRLNAFVLRARRIGEHSLAQDRFNLHRLSEPSFEIVTVGDKHKLRREFPPEETVESAAARVRPVLLNDEDCHLPSVLKAVRFFAQDPAVSAWTKAVGDQWRSRTDEHYPDRPVGVQVLVHDTKTGEEASLNELELALAWIYGDVVHHDPKRRSGSEIFGIRERYCAAVPVVAYVMHEALNVLDHVLLLEQHGVITLAESAKTARVALEPTVFDQEADHVMVAELGAQMPDSAVEPLGDEWQPFQAPES